MRYESGSASAGVLFALAAYGIWGIAPAYWKPLEQLAAAELLGHRVIWSFVTALVLVTLTRGWPELRAVFASGRWRTVALTGVLIGSNWLVFLWAVLHDQVLATSLGYYITPLVNVALGVAVLGERLSRLQTAAVALAALGVLQLAFFVGELPWVTLFLAFSFAFYGLVRKRAPVDPVAGFAVETLVLTPAGLAFLLWLGASGRADWPTREPWLDAMVLGAGVFTAAPLICFNAAAKRLRLVTLGFFQYIAPSITFVMAVFLYREPFGRSEMLAFASVWAALAVYSADSLRRRNP